MWKNPRAVAWFFVSFFAVGISRLIFSPIQPLPFYVQYNPGCAFIPVLGILFGPAGTWGSLAGVILSDSVSGLFSWLTLFRAIGAFLFAFSAQQLWGMMHPVSENEGNQISSLRLAISFLCASFPGCILFATWTGFGSEWLRLYPFPYVTVLLCIQNIMFTALIGIPLFIWSRHRLEKGKRTWQTGLINDLHIYTSRLCGILIWMFSLVTPAVGMLVSQQIYNIKPLAPFIIGVTDCPWTLIALVPLLFLQLLTLFAFKGKLEKN